MRNWLRSFAILIASVFVAPVGAEAQDPFAVMPRFTIEAFGGPATFGRFLEQSFPGGERELTGATGAGFGGSLGFWPWEKTGLRIAFTWAPTDLEFRDDSGSNSDLLDQPDLNNLDAFVISLELLRFLLDENQRLAPYATAGVSSALWRLGDATGGAGPILINGNDDTHFRVGGLGGVGVQYRATPMLAVRLEATTFGLGNPFNGKDAFRVASGATMDEPNSISVARITFGLTYGFGF